MSIISEALGKAQKERIAKVQRAGTGTAPETYYVKRDFPSLDMPHKKPLKRTSPRQLVSLIGLLSLAFLFIALIFFFASERVKARVHTVPVPSAEKNNVLPQENAVINTSAPPAETPLPVLTGIMYSSADPKAVLNGKVLTTGEMTGSYTVKKIFPGKVLITRDQEEITLKLE